MISAQDKEVFRVLYLISKEQADCFQRLLSPIDVVAQKQVVGFWRKSSVLEQTEKIVVLAMNVAAYLTLQSHD